ncbi:hypothetical protein BDV29DRAFT_139472 [Aspergillus leporis]|uniref:Rhodopsin domain-containing protein n=1 Tax=Aspergillus leporis TaxID=41062 RepID=A0A5N5WXK2_9EURO|nr:hypothetical protein BDV29DRAFT_139472 [Aspergillus leporis]
MNNIANLFTVTKSNEAFNGRLFKYRGTNLLRYLVFQGLCGLSIAMSVRGFGRHIWELQIYQISALLEMAYATTILYAAPLGLVKISICWSLACIFSTPILIVCARTLMVVFTLWAIATITISFVICRPASMSWSLLVTEGHCENLKPAYISLAIFDIIVDLLILLILLTLPLPVLWALQMLKVTRVAMTLVFSLGIITIAFGCVRPAAIIHVNKTDALYSGVMGHIWDIVENGVALIISSRPFLCPIFERIASAFGSLTCSRTTTSGKPSPGRTDDERHLVGNIPIIFHGQGHHDDSSMELAEPTNRRQTVWPGASSITVV